MGFSPTDGRSTDDYVVHLVDTPSGAIEVRELGEGPDLVFLHGALVGWELWEPVAVPLAAAGYRVILPSLPMGAHSHPLNADADLTPPGVAQLVVDLIHALELTAPTVVSNDTCTAITQLILTLHPGALGNAVMTTGDAFRHFFPPMFRPLQGLGYAPWLLKGLAKSVGSPAIRKSPLAFGLLTRVGISDEVAASWAASMIGNKLVRRDAAKVLRGINTKYTMAAARALPEVKVPVMLVWGEEDRAFPMKLATKLEALIPDCRVVTAPKSRAYVSIDAPGVLVDAIVSFIPAGGGTVGA